IGSRAAPPAARAARGRAGTAMPRRKAAAYGRVLLKLSGEALLGEKTFGIDRGFTDYLARELKSIHSLGVQIAAVVGGGNIFRGVSDSAQGMERVTAD